MASMRKALEVAGFLLFVGAGYLFVQWVSVSFAVTGNGKIKWAEGWEETRCFYVDCEE